MNKKNIEFVFEEFEKEYAGAKTELHYSTEFQLLVAVILSAQTTDKQVNKVTDKLFLKVKSPQDVLDMGFDKFKNSIKSIGLYNGKAKNIWATSEILVAKTSPLSGGIEGGFTRNLPYNPKLKEKARELRKRETNAEKKLRLDCLSKIDYKFYRQRPIDEYIVDFYCSKLGLVIEVDGDTHFTKEQIAYDKNRTKVLESYGLKVLRFTNEDIFGNTEGVYEKICEYKPSLTPPDRRGTDKPPLTPPDRRGTDILKELQKLPGVGEKTAKVVAYVLFDANVIAVDTHVHRVTNRLGIVNTKTPEQTSKIIEKKVPDKYKKTAHHALVLFGRYQCTARNPKCELCKFKDICKYYKKIKKSV